MTAEVLVPLAALGLGVALSPVAVIAAILLLVSPGGRRKGAAFLAGWVGALTAVGFVVVALEGAVGTADAAGPGWIGPAVSLAAGALLLVYGALRLLRRPGPGDDDPTPGWMTAMESAGTGRAFGTGALLAAVKPKNLVLTLAAATTIAEAGMSVPASAASLIAYLALASAGVGAPLVVAVALGGRSEAMLARWKGWLTAHNAAIVAVVLLAFGALLTWKGVTGLV